jgi:hypothetical protein
MYEKCNQPVVLAVIPVVMSYLLIFPPIPAHHILLQLLGLQILLIRAQCFMDGHFLLQVLDTSLPEVGQLRSYGQIFREYEKRLQGDLDSS